MSNGVLLWIYALSTFLLHGLFLFNIMSNARLTSLFRWNLWFSVSYLLILAFTGIPHTFFGLLFSTMGSHRVFTAKTIIDIPVVISGPVIYISAQMTLFFYCALWPAIIASLMVGLYFASNHLAQRL